MKKKIIINFDKPVQCTSFLRWMQDFGFDYFIESDSVHDDIPQEDFPEALEYQSGNTKETTLIIR